MKIRIQFIERAENGKQFRGGFLAYSGHSGDVVDAVAGQRQEIGNELGCDSEAPADLVIVIVRAAGVIPEDIAVADQLRQVNVSRYQHVAQSSRPGAGSERADDVVGFEFGARKLGQAHMPAKFPAKLELALEIGGGGVFGWFVSTG